MKDRCDLMLTKRIPKARKSFRWLEILLVECEGRRLKALLLVGQWRHLPQKEARSYQPPLPSDDRILFQRFASNIQACGCGMLTVP